MTLYTPSGEQEKQRVQELQARDFWPPEIPSWDVLVRVADEYEGQWLCLTLERPISSGAHAQIDRMEILCWITHPLKKDKTIGPFAIFPEDGVGPGSRLSLAFLERLEKTGVKMTGVRLGNSGVDRNPPESLSISTFDDALCKVNILKQLSPSVLQNTLPMFAKRVRDIFEKHPKFLDEQIREEERLKKAVRAVQERMRQYELAKSTVREPKPTMPMRRP